MLYILCIVTSKVVGELVFVGRSIHSIGFQLYVMVEFNR